MSKAVLVVVAAVLVAYFSIGTAQSGQSMGNARHAAVEAALAR